MKIAILDKRAPAEAERALTKRGFYVLEAPPSGALPAPLASHPDMLLFKCGKTVVASADYVEEASAFFDDLARLTSLDFRITEDKFGKEYPRDCIFNALCVGDRLFARTDTVSPAVLSLAEESGKRIIHVNQGYPACTVLPLGENAAITADRGMAAAMQKEGINVTLIENGGISLPPYEYGFIGGAAGVDGGTVYFLGDPMTHKCGNSILHAIDEAGLRAVSLFGGELLDLGRIIFVE